MSDPDNLDAAQPRPALIGEARTGCALCNHRVTGPGLPSFCGDFGTAYSPGRLIKPSEISVAPSWCPKLEDGA